MSSTLPERASAIRIAKWVTAIGYLVFSFAGAWWFGGYLGKVGGTGNVPDVMYLAFGPVIALAHAHGVFIYLVTTAVVLPLIVAAAGQDGWKRVLFIFSALVVWVAIGHSMYAG